jgi:ribose transport system substrate-binding protein
MSHASSCVNPYGFHDPGVAVGVSYSFLGNSWRATMENDLSKALNKAVACHEIGSVDYEYSGSSTTEQISQIDDLMLKGVKLILTDATSSTGLNAVIAKATTKGIPVVNFDTPITSSEAYVLNWKWVPYGEALASYTAKRLGGHGNVLIVRGVAGNPIDVGDYQGYMDVLAKYPKIKVIGTVYGNWDEPTVEQAVAGLLPTMPTINAVLSSGGDYGVVKAFQTAGRPIPIMVGDNRGDFLQWWWAHRSTYTTYSQSSYPQCGVLALYVGQFLLQGVHMAHFLTLQPLDITTANLPQYRKTPADAVADADFSVQWVHQNLIK